MEPVSTGCSSVDKKTSDGFCRFQLKAVDHEPHDLGVFTSVSGVTALVPSLPKGPPDTTSVTSQCRTCVSSLFVISIG
jgi:hypothetical protein